MTYQVFKQAYAKAIEQFNMEAWWTLSERYPQHATRYHAEND